MVVEVLQGDCRSVIPTLPDQSVDLVIADPPYEETSLGWDKTCGGWLELIPRILKPTGSVWIFGSLRAFMSFNGSLKGWKIAQDVVWEKHNGTNAFADRFRRVHEQALQLYRGQWRDVYKSVLRSNDATARTVRRKKRPQQWGDIGQGWYESQDGGPRMLRSVWYCRSEHGRAIHPTQKPVGIIAPLIEYSCPPGGMILDPFGGSGTTGVAAKTSGRECLLIERDGYFVNASSRRLGAM